jgi:cellulose synthase (UDP-forming)
MDHLGSAEAPWREWRGSELPRRESARQRLFTRFVALVMVIVTVIYLVWRVVFTIDPGSYLLGIPLWIAEVWAFLSSLLYMFTLWDLDSNEVPVARFDGDSPVTVLIPTYNEPIEVVLPVIAAAKNMRRVAEVWVLDDGNREWLKDLCAQIGTVYRTRSEHAHAKAGNLNAALGDIKTPFIAVFDADHVPARNYVPKVLGYFDDPKVAVVQTPQDFYNQNSFEHEKMKRHMFSEEELFYRGLLAGRNRWNAAFWCGTGAMLRVEALREIGGVATDSVTEDILSTIRLHRNGWKSVHHNEVLARGLAPSNAEQYFAQRLRWGQGAMQVLRVERWMTRKGLTLPQRLSYMATLTGWFDSWREYLLLVLPALSLILARTVLTGPWETFLVLFISTWILQRYGLARLARGRATMWTSTVFDVIRLPATLRATTSIFRVRPLPFIVTAKGKQSDKHRARSSIPRLHWTTLALLIAAEIVFALDVLGVIDMNYPQQSMAWVQAGWCLFNMAIVLAAMRRIASSRFASDRRAATRIAVTGDAFINETPVTAADLSFGGALVVSPEAYERFTDVTFSARGITLRGTVTNRTVRENDFLISIQFFPGQEVLAARLTAPAMVESLATAGRVAEAH